MKAKKLNKKLMLNKETLVNLNARELVLVRGGVETEGCPTMDVSQCPAHCPDTDFSINPDNCPHWITLGTCLTC